MKPKLIILWLALLLCGSASICIAEEITIKETYLNNNVAQDQIIKNLSIIRGIIWVNGEEIPYHDANYGWKEYKPGETNNYAFGSNIYNIHRGHRRGQILSYSFYEDEPEKGWVLENTIDTPFNISQSVWIYGLYRLRYGEDGWITDCQGRVININATRNGFNNWNVEVTYLR